MASRNPPKTVTRGAAFLTPKTLADSIGASESSVRRWIDSGDLRIARTQGGHRRIPLGEAVRFVRATGATVVRPDLLGLGPLRAGTKHDADAISERLFVALERGDREAAWSLLAAAYLGRASLASLFDGPLRTAMHRVGELWSGDERGILVEHHATQIAMDLLAGLRRLLPEAPPEAPLALGGAPHSDPYSLPSRMASLVLREAGWAAADFGPNTPLPLLAAEAIARRAQLVWISISATRPSDALVESLDECARRLSPHPIDLVIGGAAHTSLAVHAERLALLNSMSELAAFVRGIRSRPPSARKVPRARTGAGRKL